MKNVHFNCEAENFLLVKKIHKIVLLINQFLLFLFIIEFNYAYTIILLNVVYSFLMERMRDSYQSEMIIVGLNASKMYIYVFRNIAKPELNNRYCLVA